MLAETRSGGACVNDVVSHMFGTGLPFGGLGESGMGAYHGRAGFDAFSHQRAVLRRATWLDTPFRYPPQEISLARFEAGVALSSGRLNLLLAELAVVTIDANVATCHHYRGRAGRIGFGPVARQGRGGSHHFGKAAACRRAHLADRERRLSF